ncbi:MAG TPA: type II toxin-antitoxin system Phd/YefM family antitoxin [Candidatus Saccharimonadia bacterium]|nr:type II toxin-antitoxin system Phd/YefM family antitoxin [Candidatus Saccharimonadia bacterium]
MKVVNIHEAKTQLSKYLQEAAEGKEVVIGKYGQPIARLVPFESDKPKIVFGLLKGKFSVSDNFDEPDEELIRMFEGEA